MIAISKVSLQIVIKSGLDKNGMVRKGLKRGGIF